MLLCLDIGNSQIFGGLFDGEELKVQFRRTSQLRSSSDELGVFFRSVLRENDVDPNAISRVAIYCVVPDLLYSLRACCQKYFGLDPLVLRPGVKTGLKIQYRDPKEVGADRIADAVGERMTEEQETRLLKLRYRIDAAEGVAGEDAAKVLHELVDLNPLDGEALMLLAKHYSRAEMIEVDENVEQAIIFFERVAEVEGYAFEAQMLHGELLVKKDRFAEALPLLEGAYKLEPREFLEEYIATVKRAAARAR